MPRRLLGALVALALVPSSADALTPSLTVRGVAPGCQPKSASAVAVTAPAGLATGPHTYVVAGASATPCAALPVTTTATARGVRLRWTAAPGATDYRIYRDGATAATAVACCDYTDASATTTAGAPPPVAAESARAGSSPDLVVDEAFAYDTAAETLATDVVRLPTGVFLPGPVTGSALAVIDGEPAPGEITPTDGVGTDLTLTLRPVGVDPIVVPMRLSRRADGTLDVTTELAGLRLDRLTRAFDGAGLLFPTSCAAKSILLDANGAHASAPLQATDCGSLAFAPTLSLALDATGQSGAGGRPTLSAVVTQPTGQAAARALSVTLPEGVTATGGVTATATSPLAPGAASLPVTSGATPAGRSVLTLDNLPETPFTDVRFSAVLTNVRDLCSGLTAADATAVGHNGATTTARTPVALTGAATPCPVVPDDDGDDDAPPVQLPARPGVAVAARFGRTGRPRLVLTIRAGNAVAGSNLRRCRIAIPRGLRLTRGARRHLKVTLDARRTNRVTVRPHLLTVRASRAARIVTVTARRGALTAGRRARRRLSFRFAVLTQSGRTYRVVKRVTPRS